MISVGGDVMSVFPELGALIISGANVVTGA